jgi:hypothetical protein
MNFIKRHNRISLVETMLRINQPKTKAISISSIPAATEQIVEISSLGNAYILMIIPQLVEIMMKCIILDNLTKVQISIFNSNEISHRVRDLG